MEEAQETWVQSLGWEDPLQEEMATHSMYFIAWRWSNNHVPSEQSQQLLWMGPPAKMAGLLRSLDS